MEFRRYGYTEITGLRYTDTVCVTAEACVEGFEYFLIESQRGINGFKGIGPAIDGVLGMSRDSVPDNFWYEVGPLYVRKLSKAGVT